MRLKRRAVWLKRRRAGLKRPPARPWCVRAGGVVEQDRLRAAAMTPPLSNSPTCCGR